MQNASAGKRQQIGASARADACAAQRLIPCTHALCHLPHHPGQFATGERLYYEAVDLLRRLLHGPGAFRAALCRALVSCVRAISATRAHRLASLRLRPAARHASSRGNAASRTLANPPAASARTPPTPWRAIQPLSGGAAFSPIHPLKLALHRPARHLAAAQKRRHHISSAVVILAAALAFAGLASLGFPKPGAASYPMPSAAHAMPREKMAPLCVLTPPVARRMAASASSPGVRRASKHASGFPCRKASPVRAHRFKIRRKRTRAVDECKHVHVRVRPRH